VLVLTLASLVTACFAQTGASSDPEQAFGKQINVNWFYGSYIPRAVPLVSLNPPQRFQLYIRQTFTTPGIYIKTTLFALHDQITDSEPEWGSGFGGFVKCFGNRQIQFVLQNSVTSLGDGMLGWEPRYDRCRCDGVWPRTRQALVRNFVTYARTDKSLRPQLMPYLGTFSASALATTWEPGNASWQVRGYQAAITQVFIGAGMNWIGEFGPEIGRVLHKRRKGSGHSDDEQCPIWRACVRCAETVLGGLGTAWDFVHRTGTLGSRQSASAMHVCHVGGDAAIR